MKTCRSFPKASSWRTAARVSRRRSSSTGSPSWDADTPAGTWIQVEMRATTDKGDLTKWYVMGRWAYGDGDIQRTSVGGQGDADGYIAIDTFFAKDHPMTAYQLRLTLYRAVGS